MIVAVAVLGGCELQAQTLSPCSQQSVTYLPVDEMYGSRIVVKPASISVIDVGEKQFSPQGTSWLIVSEPDFTKPGPWETRISIHVARSRATELMTFKDHGSGGVSVQWLNEKMIYGSVWWGRIVSTDFIFDADKNRFLYEEMANYGQLTEPCE